MTALASTAAEDRVAPYVLPASSRRVDRTMMFAFMVLILFTTLEAPLRYVTAMAGAAWVIYLRDVAVVFAMLSLAVYQLRRQQLQTAFLLFGLFLIFHGVVSALLCPVRIALLMGMKNLLYPMFGVLFLPALLRGGRTIRILLIAAWLLTAIGVLLDHSGYAMPWKGLNATVGDYSVVINRKWNFQGEDRLAGFARDSVSAGLLVALPGLYCLLFSRSFVLKAFTTLATLAIIYLTTSKGGVLAFAIVALGCMAPGRSSQWVNKLLLSVVFLSMVLCPIILPQYLMPRSAALLQSFIDRIERVWPSSWHNIGEHSWIFGAGIGNIGVGQQFLNIDGADSADNLFVLAYGYFGILAVIYLTLPFLAAVARRSPVDVAGRYAIVTLLFVFAYGIVANVLESPVAAFLLGTALQALALKRLDPAVQSSFARPLQPAIGQAA